MQLGVPPPATGRTSPLKNYRKGRYRGDDFCLPMSSFADVDQARIRSIYQFLEALFAVLKRRQANGTLADTAAAHDYLRGQDSGSLLGWVRGLGQASLARDTTELMAKTIHDLRGGAMSALLGHLQMAELLDPDELGLRQIFFLTRDHLKIMRNALLGLDDPKREADLVTKLHSVDLIAEKWQHALIQDADHKARLEVACDFHGNIAECCVEFGALDRVLYNLVNNACRHSASGEVRLAIHSHPAGHHQPDDLCFAVSNPVSDEDRRHLLGRGDLRNLFLPGVSSTGSGFGMTVALDFVSNAYGLSRRDLALESDYLGAELTGKDDFVVWFHWPVAPDV